MLRPLAALFVVIAAVLAHAAGARCPDDAQRPGPRHVPSPDWRDQVIYFAMLDRFDDGDRSNDDQGRGEFDPADPAKYSGGDLCGLRRRLGYIQALGATAVWITPPVAQQWWDGSHRYGGYHGYWAENFMEVDRHLGTLADYRALAAALHGRGMYLVQDIVVNHVGNFFTYRDGWDAGDPAAHYAHNAQSVPHAAPTQAPFDRNDPRRRADRAAAIYHWTPSIADFSDPHQERDFQLADLDDLNTENPRVRRVLRRSYDYWIREVGVDAFRLDTAFYVPPEFLRDFLYSDERAAPGVLRAAAATGRRHFHVFGEGFGLDRPYDDTQGRKLDTYLRDAQGPLMPGMLDFPLYGSLLDVFARGHASDELADRLRRRAGRAGDVHLMPTFVDNHDVDRFLAGGTEAGLKQALLLLTTVPGIPVIYYGTEQGYSVQRAAMFAGGVESGGRDHFDRNAPLYRYLQRAIALRRAHPTLSRGEVRVLASSASGPGGLVYRSDGEGSTLVVAFNTADARVLVDGVEGLPAGARLEPLFAIDGDAPALRADAQGRLDLLLPARAGMVWRLVAQARNEDATPPSSAAVPTLAPLPVTIDDATAIAGTGPARARVALVIDGDLDRAQRVATGIDGRWQARLSLDAVIDEDAAHRLVVWDAAAQRASAAQAFRIRRHWDEVAGTDDPAGDDRGPSGGYRYPTDATWTGHHPGDLLRVAVSRAGAAWRIDVGMRDLVDAWKAPLGFDHLALGLYLEFPGEAEGARALPMQNATLPAGRHWHSHLRLTGWNLAWYGSAGADAAHEGTPLSPMPGWRLDAATRTFRIFLPPAVLGEGVALHGAHLYLATWDYDGGYRALSEEGGGAQFGGAAPDAPKVLDDAVLAVP